MSEHEKGRPRFQIDSTQERSVGTAIVVVPVIRSPEPARRSDKARLEEAVGLARAIDLDVVHSGIVRLPGTKPGTLFGTGKVDELKGTIAALDVSIVIVDHALTPVQQRNLEKAWDAKVLDRTGLILEIFGARAATREGRLQVDLAQLNYQKGRLVRSWTHLERQRGGVGFMGGPGETQIESDRRQLQERIGRIEAELETVRRTRGLHRSKRKRVPHPIVALVGYTNAGKSTLFNFVTDAEVLAKDQLFATLDPTLRRLRLPGGTLVILSDTVGFVSDLPTDLVAAFRATLEEVLEADLILHVRDVADPDTSAQAEDVADVLAQLDVDVKDEKRILEVWNKADLLSDEERERIRETRDDVALISSVTGEGVEALLARIETRITGTHQRRTFELDVNKGAAASWLHDNAHVVSRDDREDGTVVLEVSISDRAQGQFERFFG